MNAPTPGTPKEAARQLAKSAIAKGFKPVALHEYTDATGFPLYWRIRLKHPETGEKWIRPMYHDGMAFKLGEPIFPEAGKPLYLLHKLTGNAAAWIVEGETCADALDKLGLLATTSGAADSAEKADWSILARRTVNIWPDNDNAGRRYAETVARILRGLGCAVRVVDVATLNLPPKGDVVDWLAAHPEATAADVVALPAVEDAQEARQGDEAVPVMPSHAGAGEGYASGETDAQIIVRLARLTPLEYDRVRVANAELLGVRTAALDAQVRIARKDAGDEQSLVEHTEPHAHPVVIGELLDELRAAFNRHAILPPNADVAMSLWCAFTWFIEGVHFAPLLIIRAPESECGKTTVKDVVQQFVRRPLSNEGVSIAALFRVVEQEQPTLLLDDADSWLLRDPNDERHSLINSGHKRGGKVLRCVGDNHDLKAFSTFCAKVIAFIGKSKDTLHNRSIEIVLRRKMAGETIIPLRNADRMGYDTLRAKLARMEEDYLDTITKARPDLAGLDNRAADNWEPLLAIADIAGGEWPRLARQAALGLLQSREAVISTGVELLTDIEHIFDAKRIERIRTAELVQALCDDEEAGWSTYNRGRPISPRQISKRLGEYGISPKNIRFGYGDTPKGYELAQFQDAFARYLHTPSENPPHAATPPQPNNHAALSVADNPLQNAIRHTSATLKPAPNKACGGVADKPGEKPEGNLIEVEI